ncbi:hypothetical protein DTO280E4_1299 [Paecilomyces variotii]|nr:hypothetical protein DTO195F2_8048 [Paecilomyces variotii]KAJ9365004.1 hypothetical protein DTO280E4_1299 [Paecilomyces variotii]
MAASTNIVSEKSKQTHSQSQHEKTTTTNQPAPSSSPGRTVKQFANFTNHGIGLEKTLRLVQALAQVGAEVLVDTDEELAKRCAIAKGQLALSRRYFRFFKFFECFERVTALLSTTGQNDSIHTTLELGKWSCLGIYLVMEDLTILDAMGVYSTSWSDWVLLEAHKFWFCALSLSLLGSLWMLLVADKKASASKSSPWLKRIIIDGCDLLIPGSMVGWIAVSPLVVAMSMVASTLLAAQDIWTQAQVGVRQ